MSTLTIIIPAYNEAERVGKTLKVLEQFKPPKGIKISKVRLVDDGSKTNYKLQITNAKLKKGFRNKLETISYRKNRGRGYAVRKGMENIDTDYVLYVDADLSISLSNLKKFVPFMKKDYDLLFGSKKKPGAREIIKRSFLRKIVGYGHSVIASIVLGVFAWDFQGGFKMFSKKFIEEVISLTSIDRWGFDMEVIFWGKKLGYKTKELAVTWGALEQNSKVELLRDIFQALVDMVYIRVRRFKFLWEEKVRKQLRFNNLPARKYETVGV